MRRRTKWVRAGLLCLAGTGCASGGAGPTGAPATAGVLPENRGFAGGTQVQGGFTDQPSAVLDSVVAAPRGRVWSVLPAVFDTLEIETPTVERAAYTIGNPGARVARIAGSRQLSRYLECGTGIRGPNADNYEVTLQLLVRLGRAPEGTAVRTTLDAYARARDSGGEPLHCASVGTLERLVLSLIMRELAAEEAASNGGAPSPGPAPPSGGRLPVTGDVLRIECHQPGTDQTLVGEGRYVGAGDGALRLTVDTRGRTVAVPAERVIRVQVREGGSRAMVVGLVGLVIGGVAGGLYAHDAYNPDATYHLRRETVTGIGAVVGALAGGLLGAATGAMIRSDTWVDAPPEWVIRTTGAGLARSDRREPGPCPSFEGR